MIRRQEEEEISETIEYEINCQGHDKENGFFLQETSSAPVKPFEPGDEDTEASWETNRGLPYVTENFSQEAILEEKRWQNCTTSPTCLEHDSSLVREEQPKPVECCTQEEAQGKADLMGDSTVFIPLYDWKKPSAEIGPTNLSANNIIGNEAEGSMVNFNLQNGLDSQLALGDAGSAEQCVICLERTSVLSSGFQDDENEVQVPDISKLGIFPNSNPLGGYSELETTSSVLETHAADENGDHNFGLMLKVKEVESADSINLSSLVNFDLKNGLDSQLALGDAGSAEQCVVCLERTSVLSSGFQDSENEVEVPDIPKLGILQPESDAKLVLQVIQTDNLNEVGHVLLNQLNSEGTAGVSTEHLRIHTTMDPNMPTDFQINSSEGPCDIINGDGIEYPKGARVSLDRQDIRTKSEPYAETTKKTDPNEELGDNLGESSMIRPGNMSTEESNCLDIDSSQRKTCDSHRKLVVDSVVLNEESLMTTVCARALDETLDVSHDLLLKSDIHPTKYSIHTMNSLETNISEGDMRVSSDHLRGEAEMEAYRDSLQEMGWERNSEAIVDDSSKQLLQESDIFPENDSIQDLPSLETDFREQSVDSEAENSGDNMQKSNQINMDRTMEVPMQDPPISCMTGVNEDWVQESSIIMLGDMLTEESNSSDIDSSHSACDSSRKLVLESIVLNGESRTTTVCARAMKRTLDVSQDLLSNHEIRHTKDSTHTINGLETNIYEGDIKASSGHLTGEAEMEFFMDSLWGMGRETKMEGTRDGNSEHLHQDFNIFPEKDSLQNLPSSQTDFIKQSIGSEAERGGENMEKTNQIEMDRTMEAPLQNPPTCCATGASEDLVQQKIVWKTPSSHEMTQTPIDDLLAIPEIQADWDQILETLVQATTCMENESLERVMEAGEPSPVRDWKAETMGMSNTCYQVLSSDMKVCGEILNQRSSQITSEGTTEVSIDSLIVDSGKLKEEAKQASTALNSRPSKEEMGVAPYDPCLDSPVNLESLQESACQTDLKETVGDDSGSNDVNSEFHRECIKGETFLKTESLEAVPSADTCCLQLCEERAAMLSVNKEGGQGMKYGIGNVKDCSANSLGVECQFKNTDSQESPKLESQSSKGYSNGEEYSVIIGDHLQFSCSEVACLTSAGYVNVKEGERICIDNVVHKEIDTEEEHSFGHDDGAFIPNNVVGSDSTESTLDPKEEQQSAPISDAVNLNAGKNFENGNNQLTADYCPTSDIKENEVYINDGCENLSAGYHASSDVSEGGITENNHDIKHTQTRSATSGTENKEFIYGVTKDNTQFNDVRDEDDTDESDTASTRICPKHEEIDANERADIVQRSIDGKEEGIKEVSRPNDAKEITPLDNFSNFMGASTQETDELGTIGTRICLKDDEVIATERADVVQGRIENKEVEIEELSRSDDVKAIASFDDYSDFMCKNTEEMEIFARESIGFQPKSRLSSRAIKYLPLEIGLLCLLILIVSYLLQYLEVTSLQ
ncbi:hypothetical protein KP509_21G080300 [Ceratopteris richardii]|uniref:Uncharacterized protein n=2 Tax=Ceratopteris richardii TaxID=49495 RepID=A0A8T2SF02_CERRI|nr:hypothetical protein KP509_21G080300 [Ceratopteris richardii]